MSGEATRRLPRSPARRWPRSTTSWPPALQAEPQRPEQRRVVVDDEHLGHRATCRAAAVGRDRQGEDEAGAAAGCVLDPDPARRGPRRTSWRWSDRARPGRRCRTGRSGRRRSRARRRERPGPRSVTESVDPVAATSRRHRDRLAVGRMTVGIVDEVSEDLADEDRVDVDVGQVGRELEVDRRGPRARAGGRPAPRRPDRATDRGAALDLEDAGVDTGSCRAGWSPAGSAGRSRCRSGRAARRCSSSDSVAVGVEQRRRRPPSSSPAASAGRGRPPRRRSWRSRSTSSSSSERSACVPQLRRARGRGRRGWRRCGAGLGRRLRPAGPGGRACRPAALAADSATVRSSPGPPGRSRG